MFLPNNTRNKCARDRKISLHNHATQDIIVASEKKVSPAISVNSGRNSAAKHYPCAVLFLENVLNWGISSINGMVVAVVCYLIGYFVKKNQR